MPAAKRRTIDPRDVPLYNLSEAARWVGVPASTFRKWIYGRDYPAGGGIRRSLPLITPADTEGRMLSFSNIAEAHILASTRKHRISMADVRAAIDLVQKEHSVPHPHPLLSGKFYRSGKRLFVEYLSEKIAASRPIEGQRPLGDILDAYLERIQRDEKENPIRLFPMRYNDSRRVVLDFNIASGQPVIAGTGILVECLSELKKAGTPIPKIASQYGLDERTVAEAIHFLAA